MRSMFALSLALSAFAPAAMAMPITYDFTGTATRVLGIFEGRGTTLVTGTIALDSELVDNTPATTGLDTFQSNIGVNSLLSNALSATLHLGDLTLTHLSAPGIASGLRLSDQVDCGGLCGEDSIEFYFFPTLESPSLFRLQARDNSATALGVGTGNLTNSLAGAVSILDTLDLQSFDARSATSASFWSMGSSRLDFTWTSLGRTVPVPEPPPVALLAAGLLALAIGYRKRIPTERLLRTPQIFELAPGSPGIDAAAPLTTTAGGGCGTRIRARDARYVSDGFGRRDAEPSSSLHVKSIHGW